MLSTLETCQKKANKKIIEQNVVCLKFKDYVVMLAT